MKIYKNPWVSRKSYFVKTGRAPSAKMEASKSTGYSIDFWNGEWIVRKAEFYDMSLAEMPIVAAPNVSIKSIVDNAVLSAVLGYVEEASLEEKT